MEWRSPGMHARKAHGMDLTGMVARSTSIHAPRGAIDLSDMRLADSATVSRERSEGRASEPPWSA